MRLGLWAVEGDARAVSQAPSARSAAVTQAFVVGQHHCPSFALGWTGYSVDCRAVAALTTSVLAEALAAVVVALANPLVDVAVDSLGVVVDSLDSFAVACLFAVEIVVAAVAPSSRQRPAAAAVVVLVAAESADCQLPARTAVVC